MTYRMSNLDPVREFLNSVRYARIEYNRLSERIKALESRCMSITASLNSAPGGGNADAEELWAALSENTSEDRPEGKEGRSRWRPEHRKKDTLPDPAHRLVLKLRYIDVLSWEDVIQRMTQGGLFYSARQVYRIHGEALEVARALWNETHKENKEDE